MGLYRAIFRYTGGRAIWTISKACFLYFLLFAALLVVIKLPDTPRSVGLIQPAFFFILVLASRAAVGFWLGSSYKLVEEGGRKTKRKALIFGAGHAGRQSAAGFANNPEYEIVGFLDDDPKLHHLQISGLSVYSRAQLPTLIQHKGVEDVLVAISTVGRKQKQDILNFLLGAKVRVRILPSLTDLADGKVTVQEFRDVAIDDLLGREAVQPDDLLLSKNIAGKVVAVTGAGGSIGSELCRQILRLQPQRLLLIERTEFALYNIHQELEKALKNFGGQVQIIPLLASVQSKEKMLGIFKAWKPHTVYHAAAYKHVPMVEMNAAAGVQNNVFGTLYTAQAAQQAGVENFVLISTDKAVRPTNIMGASKRIAELSLQALHSSQEHFAPQLAAAEAGVVETTQAALQSSQRIRLQGKTCFSMVRFGNVLGSSGSVIPLFRSQIQNGEAITLTHQDVTRYFMSIPEAAQLVIQAGAMAKGGEVFVLDMGEPVRIYDLAERLIQLSGLSVKNEANPHGDIEIRVTGLRPGEKLYEELLIGDNPEPTSHSRIMKAHEAFLEWDELQEHLKQLKRAIHCNDLMTIYQQLQMLVSGYRSSAQIVDLLYSEFGESTSRDDSEAQNLLDGVQRGL
jgi:FlaA1/EpsC-like NDP-sugar epimerase